MIAAVGHADLTPDTMELVESELRAVLEGLPEQGRGLVRAGAGVPVAFGRAARAAGLPLVVVIPAQAAVPAIPPRRDRAATGELLILAQQVRLLSYDPDGRDACVSADERLITGCRKLLAVWDGSPSDGRDATAHLVAYARARGIPVEVLWPAGAARESMSEGAAPDGGGRRYGITHPMTVPGPEPAPSVGETGPPR